MTASVFLCDVGPRDGLQSDAVTLAPAVRAELCDRLAATGLPCVEAVSFVHEGRVPQMAGAEEVVGLLSRPAAAAFAGLVLNERGLDRLLAVELDRVHLSYGVTDAFTQRNQGMGADEAAAAAARIAARSHAAGKPIAVSLSVSFGCPYEGDVDPGVVLDHVARMAEAGVDEVLLADTIGVGVPAQVRRLVPAALAAMDGRPVGLHLHDTRHTALANADAGLEAGATHFDAAVGGLGGCPFAPGATGNVATEDLLFLLHRSGVETGVDLDAVLGVADWLAGVIGRPLPGAVSRAGAFAA